MTLDRPPGQTDSVQVSCTGSTRSGREAGRVLPLGELDAPPPWKFRLFFRKNSIHISGLAIQLSLLRYRKCHAHIKADRLHPARVSNVKLLIFQTKSERAEVSLGASSPGEISPLVIDGKKRRIGVAIKIPPRSPRFAEDVDKGQRQGHKAHREGRERMGVDVGSYRLTRRTRSVAIRYPGPCSSPRPPGRAAV